MADKTQGFFLSQTQLVLRTGFMKTGLGGGGGGGG